MPRSSLTSLWSPAIAIHCHPVLNYSPTPTTALTYTHAHTSIHTPVPTTAFHNCILKCKYAFSPCHGILPSNNPQIDSKIPRSLYTLRSTTFYVTVQICLDRPYVTPHASVFQSSITAHFYQARSTLTLHRNWNYLIDQCVLKHLDGSRFMVIKTYISIFGTLGVLHDVWTVTLVISHSTQREN